MLSIICEDESLAAKAADIARRLSIPLNLPFKVQLILTSECLSLSLPPFKPMHAEFANFPADSKKPALIKACKIKEGVTVIDATGGWGRDAAILASYGARVTLIERNPIMAILLEDALERAKIDNPNLTINLVNQDSIAYLKALKPEDYPEIIYIDPMHPTRKKSALVKKDLQILQQLIGYENDCLELIVLAQEKAKLRAVVKWPQQLPSLLKPKSQIEGKTVKFDIYSK